MIVAMAAVTGGCGTSPSPPSPSIQVDRATCETGLTTMATFDPRQQYSLHALAAGPDGTVFFTQWNRSPGVFAIPPSGGAPVRISDSSTATRAWVESDTLWLASVFGDLSSMPTSGGPAVLVGQIPQAPDPGSDNLKPSSGAFVLDATHLYMTVMRWGGAALEVWSIARAGGASNLLFSSSDAAYKDTFLGPLAQDVDALYFMANRLVRLPKAGGMPVVVRSDVGPSNLIVPFAANLYATGLFVGSTTDSPLGRFPLDSTKPPTRIAGLGIGMVDTGIADDAGAYVGFTAGFQPAESPWAIARIPQATEPSTALGCTRTLEAGAGFLAQELAMNETHVYALLVSPDSTEGGRIVRAAR